MALYKVFVVTADTMAEMGKIAHSLGNRHLPAQFQDGKMLLQYDERIEEIIGTLAYFGYKKARPVPRSIKLVLTVFLWTPIIDFLLVGIPHHPQANQDHWQAQELSFAHPANKQLTIVRLTEELDHEACQTITDQEQCRDRHTWTRLGTEPPQYNKQNQAFTQRLIQL